MLFVFYEARFSKITFQKKGASKGSHSKVLTCWLFDYDTINKVNQVACYFVFLPKHPTSPKQTTYLYLA